MAIRANAFCAAAYVPPGGLLAGLPGNRARKRFQPIQKNVMPPPRQYHIAQQHAPMGNPC